MPDQPKGGEVGDRDIDELIASLSTHQEPESLAEALGVPSTTTKDLPLDWEERVAKGGWKKIT